MIRFKSVFVVRSYFKEDGKTKGFYAFGVFNYRERFVNLEELVQGIGVCAVNGYKTDKDKNGIYQHDYCYLYSFTPNCVRFWYPQSLYHDPWRYLPRL